MFFRRWTTSGLLALSLFFTTLPLKAQSVGAPDAFPAIETSVSSTVSDVVSVEKTTGDALQTALPPVDLSPWSMFRDADWVVKAVMLGLLAASIATWTVGLAKAIELSRVKGQVRRALRALRSANDLEQAHAAFPEDSGVAGEMLRACVAEYRLSLSIVGRDRHSESLRERIASLLDEQESAAARGAGKGCGMLATVGSTAPFVGLFGTVWGIMNAFIGISVAQTTNLAVVAPGIAEALLATAIGLAAAIPAVILYNVFTRSIADYRSLLGDFIGALERLISRDLERNESLKSFPASASQFQARVVGGE